MSESGSSFTRSRAVRVASGIASFGMVAGVALVAASPASAAPVCDATFDASIDDESDIQGALGTSTGTVCLIGTFDITTGLTFNYDLTLYGLSDAALAGNGLVPLLSDATLSNTLAVENMAFTGGFSTSTSGAISGRTVIVINSTFTGNQGFFGGAIGAQSVEVVGSTFEDNVGFVGGAIAGYDFSSPGSRQPSATVTVTASTFTDNTGQGGGAIYSYGVANAYSSTFETNVSEEFGGAVVAEYGVYVENSTFVSNASEEAGGGALTSGYGGTVVQSTFLDNTSNRGGQSIASYSQQTLILLGNIFAGAGAALHLEAEDATISDEGGNLFTTPAEPDLSDLTPSTRFGLTTLALFNGATLADNGGATRTVALYAGSPAINAVPAGSLSTDQRGTVRPAVSDAGAYEFVAVLAVTGSAAPSSLLGGAVALLLAGGVLALGLARRLRPRARTRTS